MARRRMIDPNFWVSEDVARLSIFERLLLIGLFSNADDYGKGRAHPAYIRSTIFPYDDIPLKEIEKALQNIQKYINIVFYEAEGNKYYKFLNWDKWQTVQKPQESKIPEPPAVLELPNNKIRSTPESFQNDSRIIPELFQNDSGIISNLDENESSSKEKKRNKREKEVEIEKEIKIEIEREREKENKYIPSSANADMCVSPLIEENITAADPLQTQHSQIKEEDEISLNDHGKLTECSLNTHEQFNEQLQQFPSLADAIMAAYAVEEKPLTEGKQQEKNKKEEYTPEFEEFWAHYPRKIEKKRAFRVWKARLREGVPPEVLVRACKHYAEYCTRQGTEQRYIKHPSTFLGPDRPYEEFIDGVPVQEIRRNKSWGALRRLYDTRKNPQSPDSAQIIIGEVLSVD